MTRRSLAAPLVALVLAAGLLSPSAAVAEEPPVDPPVLPVVAWSPCEDDADLECAVVDVPLDYLDPVSDATTPLDLLRAPASGLPEDRLGTIFVNPGGPGASSTGFAAFFGDYVPAVVSERYDIVGIDPRGVGPSAPMECTKPGRRPSLPWAYFPNTRKQADARIAYEEWVREACTSGPAPIVDHMSTADTARDMDLIRQALGEETLNYYGISYGTQLGTTYAAMFPASVGRMILDGVLDPVAWTTGEGDGLTRPFSERLRSGYGAWQSLTAAFAECDRVGRRRCPVAGHASQTWLDIVHRLERKPFKSRRTGKVTYDGVVGGSLGYLYSAEGIPYLMRSLKQLHSAMFGSGTLRVTDWRRATVVRRVADERGVTGPYGFGTVNDSFAGVACADSDNPTDPLAWIRAGNRADRSSPWFGKSWTWASSICAGWPAVTKVDRFPGPFSVVSEDVDPETGVPPVLVVGNTYDPATPLLGARAVNRLLGGSRLLVMDGWGHGALGTGSCIEEAYGAFLIDGTLPPAGAVCEPDSEVFPAR